MIYIAILFLSAQFAIAALFFLLLNKVKEQEKKIRKRDKKGRFVKNS